MGEPVAESRVVGEPIAESRVVGEPIAESRVVGEPIVACGNSFQFPSLYRWKRFSVSCEVGRERRKRFSVSIVVQMETVFSFQLGTSLWHWIAYPVQRLTCDRGCIHVHKQPGLRGEIPVWFHSSSLMEVASTLMNLPFPHTAMPHGATFCNTVPYCAPRRICIAEPGAAGGWG